MGLAGRVAAAAAAEWNGCSAGSPVQGGPRTARRTFYTALYHSCCSPRSSAMTTVATSASTTSVHRLAAGQVQYSNISECDIYRSEVPLLALLLPGPTSQMVQSLLRDAAQTRAVTCPKWVIADNDASEWDGDSVDPIIADA